MKSCLITLLLLCFLWPATAQFGDALKVLSWSTDEGLHSGYAAHIQQDTFGFIWIADVSGLSRFDGESFRVYRDDRKSPGRLRGNQVFVPYLDQRRRLWVNSDLGLQGYNAPADGFEPLRMPGDSTPFMAETIVFDEQDRLWTRKGREVSCYLLDYAHPVPRIIRRLRHFFLDYEIMKLMPHNLLPEGEDVLIIGNLGVVRLSGQSGKQTHIPLPTEESICQIWKDSRTGRLTFLTSTGIYQAGPDGRYRFIPAEGMDQCSGRMIETRNGAFLIGRRRIYRWDNRQLTPLGISIDADIVSAHADLTGNLWLGTDSRGIRYVDLRPSAFTTFAQGCYIGGPPVLDSRDSIWVMIGQWPNDAMAFANPKGYYLFSGNGVQRGGAAVQQPHLALAHGVRPGEKWVLVEQNELALYRLSPGAAPTRLAPFSAPDTTVMRLATTAQGVQILVSKAGRLMLRNLYTGQSLTADFFKLAGIEDQAFRDNFALLSQARRVSVAEGRDGWIWMSTYFGVFLLKPDWSRRVLQTRSFPLPSDLKHLMPTGLQPDRQDTSLLWMSTLHGLYRMRLPQGRFEPAPGMDNFRTDIFYTLIQSADGILWIGSQRGLIRYDPQSQNIILYTRADGLPAGEFNSRTAFEAPDGRIFMGTVAGMIAFYPDRILGRSARSPIVITGIHFPDTVHRVVSSRLKFPALPYYKNSLEIHFALLDYLNPTFNRYRYRLTGAQEGWVYLGQENSLSFAELAPGKYDLEISGTNGKSEWSEPARLSFVIRPPWWRQYWAYALYALLLIALPAAFFYNRLGLERERNRLALVRHEAQQRLELEAFKARLFTSITHDIRTPLTLILGLAGELAAQLQGKAREMASGIRYNGNKLLLLVNQMQDLAYTQETGVRTLYYKPGNLSAFIAAQTGAFAHGARQAGVDLSVRLPDTPLLMEYDETALQSVVLNLLSNALKFTPAGGSVEVQLSEPQDGIVALSVSDTGPGIPPEDLPWIFDRYYQGSNGTGRGGMGVGLAYALELAVLMGGDIAAESQPGQGSTFRLSLPWIPAAESAGEQPQQPEPGPAGTVSAPEDNEDMCVLIVEDDPGMAAYIRSLLDGYYHVITAANGVEALEAARAEIPDVVISDIMMPEMDGLELCRHLKTDIRTSHIPFILLTAKTRDANMQEGLAHGADAYLTKPFSREVLLQQTANLLRLRQSFRHHYARILMNGPGHTENQAREKSQDDGADQVFILQLTRVIESNYQDPLFGVPQIERAMAMSKSQLHRKVNALLGYPPGHALRTFRLEAARKLLLEQPQLSVSEVGFSCGFNDPNYFSTAFRQTYGMAPRQYRTAPPE